jgi:hypothetical protein
LTKSRFKQGLECPRKLYYGGLDEYANQQIDDPFLESLAEGGFQVGELAKAYFPGGFDIETLDYEQSLLETNELLKRDNVVIFEAAVRYRDLFIRVDVLEKKGKHLFIHEVKAKSIGAKRSGEFLKANGQIKSEWKPYLYDVAFQKFVVAKAFPDHSVSSYLMLVDKTARPRTSGLNQKIQVVNDNGRKSVRLVAPLTPQELSEKLLVSVGVDHICGDIFESTEHRANEDESFADLVTRLAGYSLGKSEPKPSLQSVCGKCEFYCSDGDESLRDGRVECLSHVSGLPESVVASEPLIFELWGYRKKQALLDQGVLKLAEVSDEDIGADPYVAGQGLETKQRQQLQLEASRTKQPDVWVDKAGLAGVMDQWRYPLNFIDFETTRVALPFHEGQQPYEAVAFQYSHHILYEDGRLDHHSQYLNAEPGVFPNFDFLRELKNSLEGNEGTIFCYSHHENSILNAIKEQLETAASPQPDHADLIAFVKQIAKPKRDSADSWESPRLMVDLLEVVKGYLYLPTTRGSNSIKHVLPAVLNGSPRLAARYSQKLYEKGAGATSLNFDADWRWLVEDRNSGIILDPYKRLPPIFEGYGQDVDERLANFSSVDNGGAALTAYAKLQFEDLRPEERRMVEAALFKYCELDTLAMVMLYEYFMECCQPKG